MPHPVVRKDTPHPALLQAFHALRSATERLAAPLSPEDAGLQSMEDASPAKWHLGHTSWFFETFILKEYVSSYQPFDPGYAHIFNSYYVSAGTRHARHARGLLSRPPLDTVFDYRRHVTNAITDAFDALPEDALARIELGIHHERQHQELLLTDVLHAFSFNPLAPAYSADAPRTARPAAKLDWTRYDGGIVQIGHSGPAFAFDNEGPAHDCILLPYALSTRLITNAEWLDFMADGGYRSPLLWLSDGWATCEAEGWEAPLYWQQTDGAWHRFSAHGLRPLDLNAPVSHISYYEADAFARWAGARLPSEFEWESAAEAEPIDGNFVESENLTPVGGAGLYGDVWQWTQSPYQPYPRFKTSSGALGEYNGKFMANQMVLRGGSCFTPRGQMRASYRNFFYPHQRWQMTGLRLAKDI
ncbi:MAG: ergothioneine biosynthesis protein EgtB [Pseudomonadota bacterium]